MQAAWYWANGDLELIEDTEEQVGLGLRRLAYIAFEGVAATWTRDQKLKVLRSLGSPEVTLPLRKDDLSPTFRLIV